MSEFIISSASELLFCITSICITRARECIISIFGHVCVYMERGREREGERERERERGLENMFFGEHEPCLQQVHVG